ncbi:DMT family transporter [Paraglaciecola sp. L1A13]|uniref:DMT family transporter n=1 Tax=Paraglaciecola sp. L1A13 TaxID=2686359 RepID=UPI00131EB688|nr:DMT family transporter [Paraglaciecola sp. L1A13]
MQARHFIELIFLAGIWGAAFIFTRTATPEFGPISLITMRAGIASLILLPFVCNRLALAQITKHWQGILIVGLTNTAIPFCLFSYSLLHIGAGYASVMNATAPMFGALIGLLWLKQRISGLAVVGLVIGFMGVAILSAAQAAAFNALAVLPTLATLGATALYGYAGCFTKQYLSDVSPMALAAGSLFAATLCLLPLNIWFMPSSLPSSSSWIDAIALGSLCTALAYLLYFRLIANVGPSNALMVAYLIPAFGIMWGIILLGETFTMLMWAGVVLVISGVVLATGIIERRRLKIKPAL